MKLDAKMMAEAKDHYMDLEDIAEEAGISIDALLNQVMKGDISSDPEEMDEEDQPAMDKGKVALMVAKLKGAKAEE